MDVVTAVSASGPAYFFLLIEMLEHAGVAQGLTPQISRKLAVETAYGSGAMAHAASESPAVLRQQVTSKGGTTAAALDVLEERRIREAVDAAVAAATRRAAELAKSSARISNACRLSRRRSENTRPCRAIIFVVGALLQLVVTIFLLRVLLPLARADARNQLSQAVIRLTNRVVLPLRKVLPPIGKVDTASIVALVLVQLLATGILWSLRQYPWVFTPAQFFLWRSASLLSTILICSISSRYSSTCCSAGWLQGPTVPPRRWFPACASRCWRP